MQQNKEQERRTEIRDCLRRAAKERFGWGMQTSRERWESLSHTLETLSSTKFKLDHVCLGIFKACDSGDPRFFPTAQQILNEIYLLDKHDGYKPKSKSDIEYEEATVQQLRRAKIQTNLIDKYGYPKVKELEQKFCKINNLDWGIKAYRDLLYVEGLNLPEIKSMLLSYEEERKGSRE